MSKKSKRKQTSTAVITKTEWDSISWAASDKCLSKYMTFGTWNPRNMRGKAYGGERRFKFSKAAKMGVGNK